jgi:hypothetical protein
VSLTFPSVASGPAPLPGLVSEWILTEIGPGESIEVDCGEIPSQFFSGLKTPPYIQGFLLVESQGGLGVSAVYTAGQVDESGSVKVVSIDVEQIKAQRAQN